MKTDTKNKEEWCALCRYFASKKGDKFQKCPLGNHLVRISESLSNIALGVPDLKQQVESMFPDYNIQFGQYICSNHLEPLPVRCHQYTKMFPPVLHQDLNGAQWGTPSKRKVPPVRYELPVKKKTWHIKEPVEVCKKKVIPIDPKLKGGWNYKKYSRSKIWSMVDVDSDVESLWDDVGIDMGSQKTEVVGVRGPLVKWETVHIVLLILL